MAPPRAKTTAGSKELRGIDLTVTDPIERVNQFLAFARSGEYDVDISLPHYSQLA
jgi:hypothetical protein